MAGWIHCVNKTGKNIDIYSKSVGGTRIGIIFPNERYVRLYETATTTQIHWRNTFSFRDGNGNFVTGYLNSASNGHYDAYDSRDLAYSTAYDHDYNTMTGWQFQVRRTTNVYKADGTTLHGVIPAGGLVGLTDRFGYANSSTRKRLSIDSYYDPQIGTWKYLGTSTYGWVDVGFAYGAYESNMTIYGNWQ